MTIDRLEQQKAARENMIEYVQWRLVLEYIVQILF
jgi:hypothetical protein